MIDPISEGRNKRLDLGAFFVSRGKRLEARSLGAGVLKVSGDIPAEMSVRCQWLWRSCVDGSDRKTGA
jgi:hypothetical protein